MTDPDFNCDVCGEFDCDDDHDEESEQDDSWLFNNNSGMTDD
jgi:hypothetical protein